MKYTNQMLSIVVMLVFSQFAMAQCGGTEESSTMHFDLDNCEANYINNTNADYSELTYVNSNPGSCAAATGSIYRIMPEINTHSCTLGVGNTPGVCVSADSSCGFTPNSMHAIRIDVNVDPGGAGSTSFDGLDFFQAAPPTFIWLGGSSGPNNYPTRYGVRISVGGTEIFSSADNVTSPTWAEANFDFTGNPAFSVTQATTFNIEILGYCPAGNGAALSLFDIDEISVSTSCTAGETVSGGTISGGPFSFCVGDGVSDFIAPGSIALSGNAGPNSQWVITDEAGMILGLPGMPSDLDFDGAGNGTCLIWHLSFEDGLTGAAVGANAGDLQGCFELSNPISVFRGLPIGGTLSGGPFEVCVGDGVSDIFSPDDLGLTGAQGTFMQWVVTDPDGNILALPDVLTDVDFDGTGVGTCLIWNLSFEDGIDMAVVGNNASQLTGCFELSNPVEVNRINCGDPCNVAGGTIEGGPFEVCVGDGVPDMLAPGSITLSGNSGPNSQWVITDSAGMILGLPGMPSEVDFEEAGVGVCLIWHLSFEDGLTGAAVGELASNLGGCFSLSNPIQVNRIDCGDPCDVSGGTLEGGPFEFCVGDGVADMIAPGSITLSGNAGPNSQWVITDSAGMILGLPGMPGEVDFDGAGVGTCLVWHLSFEDGLTGAEVGQLATNLEGCFSLSNPITVNRVDCGDPCDVAGGVIEGGPFEFCVGDGVADMLAPGSITLSGNSGPNSQWVITDSAGMILGLPGMPGEVDFDGAGVGVCLIWHLSFEDGLTGAAVGELASNLGGCFSLSNSIAVNRVDCGDPCDVSGGVIEGGPFEFCVGDGVADMIAPGSITLSGNAGTNSQWVITDSAGMILGLPGMPGEVDFDGAGVGVCLIWHLSFEDGLTGAAVGELASNLGGCFSLSNSIEVNRVDCGDPCDVAGGVIEGGPFEFCVGDGVADMIAPGSITLSGNSGTNSQWVITDSAGMILGLPGMPGEVDFDGAGVGTCLIWHLSFEDGLTGAAVGELASNLGGCFSLSNSIEVFRNDCGIPCDVFSGNITGGPFEFCVGNGVADTIPEGAITLDMNEGTNSQWLITSEDLIILGVPGSYSEVNFDDAGPGICLVWHLSHEDDLTGLEVGNPVTSLGGCFSVSNSIEVIRTETVGGVLGGGPFVFCSGDGQDDFIDEAQIVLSNNAGTNSQWVITDTLGTILGLPGSFADVNFEEAGPGVCLVWHLSYEDGLTGAVMGGSASDLQGCFSLSNPISVTRTDDPAVCSGSCPTVEQVVLYAIVDNVLLSIDQNIGIAYNALPLSVDYEQRIIGMTYHYEEDALFAFGRHDDFVELLRIDRYTGELTIIGPVVQVSPTGMDLTLAEALEYDYVNNILYASAGNNDLSENFWSRILYSVDVNTAECTFVADISGSCNDEADGLGFYQNTMYYLDGCPDPQEIGLIDLTTGEQEPLGTLDIDSGGYPIAIHPETGEIYHMDLVNRTLYTLKPNGESSSLGIVYGEGIYEGFASDLAFANSIVPSTYGGVLSSGVIEFCVNDGEDDIIEDGEITAFSEYGPNLQWVLTDDQGMILVLPDHYSQINFEGSPEGDCFLWLLSYEDGISGLEMGASANDLEGCFDLSNPILVSRVTDGDACQGLVAPNNDIAFDIFPNPSSSDQLNLDFIRMPANQGEVIITDIVGNIKMQQTFEMHGNQLQLSVTDLPAGAYWVIISSKNRKEVKKFIKF